MHEKCSSDNLDRKIQQGKQLYLLWAVLPSFCVVFVLGPKTMATHKQSYINHVVGCFVFVQPEKMSFVKTIDSEI